MIISKNQYVILKFLLSYKNECNYYQLMNHLNCTKEEVDIALHDLQLNMYQIINTVKHENKISIVIKDADKLAKIMKGNRENRDIDEDKLKTNRSWQIVNKLIKYKDKNREYVSLERLAEELFVSRSTLIKDMNHVKVILKKYNLSIEGITNKGICIMGDEFHIRLYILNQCYVNYSKEQPSQCILDHEIKKIVDAISSEFLMDQTTIDLFEKVIQLSIIRCFHHKNLQVSIEHYHNMYKDHSVLLKLRNYIVENKQIKLTEHDFDFLCFPLYLISTKKQRNEKNEVDQMLETMLDRIYKEYQFYLDKVFIDEEVKYHLSYMINRIIFKIPSSISMDEKIESNYPFAYQISKSACSVIEQKLNVYINAQEISYLALYFQMAIQKKYNVSKKFGIIRSTGRSVSKLIENRIRSMFYEGCEFIEIDEHQIDTLEAEEINAIFTLNPIYKNSKIPIILLSNIFDTDYIAHVVNQGEQRTLLASENIMYHKRIVEAKDKVNTYKENIADVLSFLYEYDVIEHEFCNTIKQLDENKFSYDSAFMPHAIIKNHDKFLLSMTLYYTEKKKKNYQLIFLIGIPEKVQDGKEFLIVQIYDYIFDIINRFVGTSKLDLKQEIKELEKEGKL